MAVIQISKIQQRRGQKLVTGMPQLSSGELAWAVDTQELFVGNGSLAEGAPYVGNTKILTEHDNILELANSYRFANDDLSISFSVPRSLQSKIDEIEVSVLDFGSPADGSTDCSEAFERAFDELFQNPDDRFRKVLKIPNGDYLFTRVLRIPSNVSIKGETRDGVVLNLGSFGIEFTTPTGLSPIDFSSTDRPDNVSISNLTIFYEQGTTDITGLKNSIFDNVRFLSEYQLGQSITERAAAYLEFDLTSVELNGYVEISGTGVSTTATGQFLEGDANVIPLITRLATDLNNDPIFDDRFLAGVIGESLIISFNDDNIGRPVSEILSAFTVRVDISGEFASGTAPIATPVSVEASTGIELVPAALTWTNRLFGTRVNDVVFNECVFDQTALAIKCIQNFADQQGDVIKFQRCVFTTNDTSIYLQGSRTHKCSWQLYDCQFEDVAKQAVWYTLGTGMVLDRIKIKNCGNSNNGPASPSRYVFQFGSKYGNVITNLISDRHQAAGLILGSTSQILPGLDESLNSGMTTISNDYYSLIETTPDSVGVFEPLMQFAATHRFIEIDYVLTLDTNLDDPSIYGVVRKGKLTIVLDDTPDEVAIVDNYTYSSPYHDDRDITSSGGVMMTNFEFDAQLLSRGEDSTVDTLLVSYRNPRATGKVGTISYSISYGV
jgi:hypothetical protein